MELPDKNDARITRRALLGSAAIGAGAFASAAASADPVKVPTAVLGRTGVKVSRLAHGGSWDIDPEVLSIGAEHGLNYLDTAETYRGGQSELKIGDYLQSIGATGHSAARKKLWLITKTHRHMDCEARLQTSLTRMKQDYADCMYMHQIQDPALTLSPDVKAMAARIKKSGQARFFGFSVHDDCVVECLNAASKSDFVDVIMFRYDHHYYPSGALDRAIDACHKNGIGLVAMKTQVGGMTLPDKFDAFKKRGLSRFQAAIKAVAADERITSICSEMVTVDQVRQNALAMTQTLTAAEGDAIREHARMMSHLWCRGCQHLCRPASGAGANVAVADSLRFLMYHDHYGKRDHARDLFNGLPEDRRDLSAIANADWESAERACPYHVPLTVLMPRVADRLA